MNLAFAWRNIWRNKSRSLIIMSSVVIGLVAGIFVLGLYDGMLRSRVRTVIDQEVAHLQIHQPSFKDDYDPVFVMDTIVLSAAIKQSAFIQNLSCRTVTQGMLATTTGSSGVQVNGIIMAQENPVSQLNKKIVEGNEFQENKKNEILIGKKLADKMKLKVGSKLVLTFTDKESNITSGAFRVSGIYQSVNAPLDELNVYVKQSTLNAYLGIDNACHEAAIILHSDEDIEAAKEELKSLLPDYKIETWKETSPETYLMVGTVNQYSLIIIAIIMLALAFGIINTMLMSVLERTREIGMLTALGMNRMKVFRLILSETILLTLVGTPIGLLASWIIIDYYSSAGIDISSISGDVMSGFGFSSMIYPEFPVSQLQSIMIIVISTALFASIFPSMKAMTLQPADALRQ